MAPIHPGPNDTLWALAAAVGALAVSCQRVAAAGLGAAPGSAAVAAAVALALAWTAYQGYRHRRVMAQLRQHTAPDRPVVVVGGGFGGLLMASTLLRAGVPVVVYEKAATVGGVWAFNNYPGAACDVTSNLYSFSFFPQALWSRAWPAQAEILDYIRAFVAAHNLAPVLRLQHEVVSMAWQEDLNVWRVAVRPVTVNGAGEVVAPVATAAPTVVTAHSVVCATGQLSRPAVPRLPGAGTFQGTAFHTSNWPDDLPLADKRVVVIGTGPTAVQVVPAVAPHCRHLTVVQRSPSWHVDKHDKAYGPTEHWLLTHVPFLRLCYRASAFVLGELMWYVAFATRCGNRLAASFMRKTIRKQLRGDVDLTRRLTPSDPVGCKRVLISSDYLPSFLRANVELVCGAACRITSTGVVVKLQPDDADTARDDATAGSSSAVVERLLPADVIVYATGFRTQAWCAPITIHGRGGVELQSEWGQEPFAYLGMCVPKFPNFYLMYGPYTNLGHNSILYMLECQAWFIAQVLAHQLTTGATNVEVLPAPTAAFVERMQRRLTASTYAWGCASWYTAATGRIVNNWGGGCVEFAAATRRLNPNHFQWRAAP